MTIGPLTDRYYPIVSDEEAVDDVAQWLTRSPYFVVIGNDLDVKGIVTSIDVLLNPERLLADFNLAKPKVKADQSPTEVREIMVRSRQPFLPVYENDVFIGVISRITLTDQ